MVDGGAALAPARRGKRTGDIDSGGFRGGHQSAFRHMGGVRLERRGPPSQFGQIGSVVTAQRLGEPGRLGQSWTLIVGHHVQQHVIRHHRAAQRRVQGRPAGRRSRTVTGRCGVDGSHPPVADVPP